METNRGNQGKFISGIPAIHIQAILEFGYRALEIEIGDEEIRTPSDVVLDFAYGLNLLLASDGVPSTVLAMYLYLASRKLKSLAKDVLLHGMDEDIAKLYKEAEEQGILIRQYPEGKDKSDTD